ncbi:dihydrolipoamide acetyltransferase [Mesorhizobium sp. L-8-10]|uniref:alpha/beta fold hydrolase n=1 Tax=unclassified Mesorhizobium TaxID=325217 RepID=UPI001925ACDD|nr:MULTISPECIES: alpha/beta fold hydrolase [unclassified Mesorhizobium]BCH23683.1 dihydrolipoamide acetyltransferase [Mesorhizobium sp. L-8-3]BCH31413.1 dihydrolipoamide acetyltransferase [Mesorhizobium sp. L-8-10]
MDQLFAREAGTGAETVVLLHGFAGTHRVWAEVQDRLAAQARVIAYDLPGHAASLGWPGAGPVKAAVRAVLEDLSRRGIERAHLAGHSMGGAISTLVALAEPARVASLCLFAPGGFGPEINRRLLFHLASARSEAELRDALDAMCGFEGSTSEASVHAAAAMRAIPGQIEKLIEIAGIIAGRGRQGAIPRDALAGLTMPVAVAWGALDPVLPFHQTNDLPPLFALHRLPGAGHMLIEEAPDLVTELIRRQLR